VQVICGYCRSLLSYSRSLLSYGRSLLSYSRRAGDMRILYDIQDLILYVYLYYTEDLKFNNMDFATAYLKYVCVHCACMRVCMHVCVCVCVCMCL